MSVNFARGATKDTVNCLSSTHHKIQNIINLFDYESIKESIAPYQSKNFLITKDNFINLFYKTKGTFLFALEDTLQNILQDKIKLNGWTKAIDEGKNVFITKTNIVNEIIDLWTNSNNTNINKNNWSSSSYMNIVCNLLKVNNWTTLHFPYTLSYDEILRLFNQTELVSGNKLKLIIIVDNENILAKPVEIILNFEIA